ncbi:SGNH hydrolase-type esterase domain-containing protein [Mycena amicta]|nr:SGNH hydrolase-type esterase domain-containing protein [Mycena amicta]
MFFQTFISLLLLAKPLCAVDTTDRRWITTWTTMPQLAETPSMLPPAPFNGGPTIFFNSTIRQTLHMSIGGEAIRIRFSNAFGDTNLDITAATVAMPVGDIAGNCQIETSTMHTLTFGGSPSFSVPVGGLVLSDPISFPIEALQTISVSLYLAEGQTGNITMHPSSWTTTWLQLGNSVQWGNFTDPSANNTIHWYFVSGVETFTTRSAAAFFVVGDSITDGNGSDLDENDRWPDLVLQRMQNRASTKHISVNNQAAGGNRILTNVKGPNLLSRIDRDVLAQTGMTKYVMIFEGVNDLGKADATEEAQSAVGDELISAFQQIAMRLHAAEIPVFAATITPFGGATIDSPVREQQRQRVNAFIRTTDLFEAVVDFDKIVADPNEPTRLRPEFNSGDWLHPNVLGYTAVASAFPLQIFDQFADGVNRYY